ncbi:MAG: Rrf2 family transcriptional regulator [Thermostichales cyanobacterium SZTDM-1c_bins_54]
MVELSAKSEYALLALLALARCYRTGELLQIKEIATRQGIPDRYLEQVLASLRRAGLVQSQRGAKGGYSLGKPPWAITVQDVLLVIEGEEVSKRRPPVSVEQAVLYRVWEQAQEAATAVFRNHSLQDLADDYEQRSQTQFMYYI